MSSSRRFYPLLFVLILFIHIKIISASPFDRITSPTFELVGSSVFDETMNVRAFVQDKQGYLWLGAEQGLLRYDGYEFKRFSYAVNDENFQIQDIAYDQQNVIWIATQWKGVFKYNIGTGNSQHFVHNENILNSISDNRSRALHINQAGIWVSTMKGLNLIDPKKNKVTRYFINSDHDDVLDINEDQQNNLLVATANGLYIKRADTANFVRFDAVTSESTSLLNRKIRDIYVAKNNSIWLSTVNSGNWQVNLTQNTLYQLDAPSRKDSIDSMAIIQVNDSIWFWTREQGILSYGINDINLNNQIIADKSMEKSLTPNQPLSLFEDQSGLIWLGAQAKGIQFYNPSNTAFRVANKSALDNRKINVESPRAIIELDNNELLVSGSKKQNIDRIDSKLGVINTFSLTTDYENAQRKLSAFTFLQKEKNSIWIGTYPAFMVKYNLINHTWQTFRAPLKKQRHGAILSMQGDPNDGQIWVGMSEGMLRFDPDTREFTRVKYNFQGPLFFLYFDRNNNLWTGNKKGLYLLENNAKKWRHFDSKNTPTLKDHAIASVLQDKQENIWVGTESDIFLLEILNESGATFSSTKEKLDIKIKDAENLFEDKHGRIWSSIDFLFDPKTWIYRKITKRDTRDLNHYTQVFTKTHSGIVVMGGAISLTFIEPEKLSNWQYQPTAVINQTLVDSKPTALINKNLIVPASAKRFSFNFAAIDFSEPDTLNYKYRLKGYNEQWNFTNASNRSVSYTSLSPGKYLFEVTAMNRSNQWSPKIASVNIVITPSFYQKWWFRLTIAVVLSIVLYLIIRWRIKVVLKKGQDELEKQTAIKHSEMMDDLIEKKNQLLADVSHELGTPLTVLKLQVEALKDDVEDDVQATYESLDSKLNDIGHLIGDIHQLAQADTGVLQLNKQNFDINEAINNWQNDFTEMVEKHGLSFAINNKITGDLQVNFDRVKLKQVLSNLLANSIKYTDKPGSVVLTLESTPNKLRIIIQDSAPSINEKDLKNIFERLYRVESSRNRETGGSGLGLAICKSLIEAHDGEIYAETSELGGVKVVIDLLR